MQKTLMFVSASLVLCAAGQAFAGVKGSVSFAGKPEAAAPIDMTADPKCKAMNPKAMTDDTRVAGGKVADVFVYIKNPPAGDYKPEGKVTLDQKGCMYSPKVMGIMVGQDFEIV